MSSSERLAFLADLESSKSLKALRALEDRIAIYEAIDPIPALSEDPVVPEPAAA
jgi:hypothetical protein